MTMIQFAGTETFPVPREQAFAKLSDAGFLASCLAEAIVSEANLDRAVWKVKPKLAFLSGELDTTCTAHDRQTPNSVEFHLETRGVGSASTVDAVLTFSDDGTGTIVHWTGGITTMTGLLKLAPRGLVEGTAKKVIADAWASIRQKLTA